MCIRDRDHCDRGRVYYYMEDYTNAKKELLEASKKDNTEALLLMGMVYLAQDAAENAQAMYKPVSYTHLDVYKRQLLKRTSMLRSVPNAIRSTQDSRRLHRLVDVSISSTRNTA